MDGGRGVGGGESGGAAGGGGKVRVKREPKTAFQLEVLEKTFAGGQYPSVELIGELSKQLGLSERQLQMWFCHKRLQEQKLQREKRSKKVISGSGADVIATVEAKLGERLGDDGPILGMKFDPLPAGAFGNRTRLELLKSSLVENVGNKTDENTETHEDMNQEQTSPQVDNIQLVIKVEEGERSVSQNESIDGIVAEQERAGTFQSVPLNGDKNQASTQDVSAELKKVSYVLSMLSSPNKFYTPQGDPLDEEAEKAKQSLIQLVLDKNFGVLKEWQEKDIQIKSKIEAVEADILQLKAELREKELTRESLVKQKSDLFDQNKMSIDEAEKLLQEMVTVKLQGMLL